MEQARHKAEILKQREVLNMAHLSLQKTDTIPIVNYSWERSFAIVENNKKALLQRGWSPMNRALLVDPEIARTKDDQITTITPDWTKMVLVKCQ